MGDFSHLKNKKGGLIQQPLPQPTLPDISIDDDLADIASLRQRAGTPTTTYTAGERQYASDAKAHDYATMPAYNTPYSHMQDPNAYARYNQSVPTLSEESKYPEDDYGSTTNFVLAAEGYGQDDRSAQYHESQDYAMDPYDVYVGYATNEQLDPGGGQHGAQQGQHPRNAQDDVAYDARAYFDQTGGYNEHQPPSNDWYGGRQFHAV